MNNVIKIIFVSICFSSSVLAMEALRQGSGQADLGKKLLKAAHFGNLERLQELIKAKADVNSYDDYGSTALMLAAEAENLPCVQALISAKANVNYTKHQHRTTALINAACAENLPCVQALIAAKACINQRDIYGSTALRLVAANNSQNSQYICEELVNALLKLPNNAQKKSIIAVLSCGTKRKKGLFKKCMVPKEITQQIARYMVEACEQANRDNFVDSVAYYEIGKIETPSMKKALLEKYNPQQSICTIQ